MAVPQSILEPRRNAAKLSANIVLSVIVSLFISSVVDIFFAVAAAQQKKKSNKQNQKSHSIVRFLYGPCRPEADFMARVAGNASSENLLPDNRR